MTDTRVERTLDALPDTIDFRDAMYVPALIEVAALSDVEGYRRIKVPVLDQGREGACTGFALATVANYLLSMRGKKPTADEVSAAMLYQMAKRYDEWPGEDYDGSSARGAMKGWHKHGACAAKIWEDNGGTLNDAVAADALKRPLGAYFRVNHRDLVAMHAAITEVGVLSATARVHSGWMNVQPGDENIEYQSDLVGGHAFAIVGYDHEGFWIQNSWGPDWGSGGLARLGYADWLENGTDVWVAALGVPVALSQGAGPSAIRAGAPDRYEGNVYSALRPHIVTCKNDGQLDPKGEYGLTEAALDDLVGTQIPRTMANWQDKRLLLYAHGGLVAQPTAVQHAANTRAQALDAEVYPLNFIWRSDVWSTIRNILADAFASRRDEGFVDRAKDFMLDRLDDTLEPVARALGGKALWDEMKENAQRATTTQRGAARLVAERVIPLLQAGSIGEVHLAGHSAGAIFMAPLAKFLTDAGVTIQSVSLWAPACTMELFDKVYKPLCESGGIRALDLYTLDDATERDDDCANIYHKSLLYLVSGAFETKPRIPLFRPDGTALLGLERDAKKIAREFWAPDARKWYRAPASPQSDARHHGDFDDDAETFRATLERITGGRVGAAPRISGLTRHKSRERRRQLDAVGLMPFR